MNILMIKTRAARRTYHELIKNKEMRVLRKLKKSDYESLKYNT